jgi:hypothetical protein
MGNINPATRAIKNYPVDDRVMFWDGDDWRPFADIAEANAEVISSRRYVGLMVRLVSGWHEYKNGILDTDLVPLKASGKFDIKVDGEEGSPVVDEYTYQNDLLIGANVIEISVNKLMETKIDGDFTFNPTTGTITRVNSWSANDTAIINY